MYTSYFPEPVNVTLQSKRGFIGVIKSRTLRGGDYLELFSWANSITRLLIREGQKGQSQR